MTGFAAAMALHEAGRCDEAAAAYRVILEREPDHPDSLHLLGLITAERDDPNIGIAMIRRAMVIDPGRAAHHNSLGHAYRRLGRHQDAVREYQAGISLRPAAAAIHNNLATALGDLGLNAEAIGHYQQAAQQAPWVADIWYNLANALAATDAETETEACYRKAIDLRPGFANALGNFGRWLTTLGRWADAEGPLAEALTLVPNQAGLWNNLGVVSAELGRPEAEICYRTAIDIEPRFADAHYNLGCLLSAHGQGDAAIECHLAAIIADPAFAPAHLALCMAHLPIVYASEAEIAERRDSYGAALEILVANEPSMLAGAIGTSQPFFLPYQEENDIGLQSVYGRFACEAMAGGDLPVAPRPLPGQRIRLGIVSGFFCDHTVSRLFLEGWVGHIDREQFEVIGFHTGTASDTVTERLGGLCDRFVRGLGSGEAWHQAISAAAPHVLLYPEVGIDPMAGRLAAIRLAPTQCVAWGQPETTGMPTMDYFLSSALMEPADADACYTERLVRLPGLGLHYTPDPPAAAIDRVMDAPVFWSGQALYKYLPRYDGIYPRIAAELGDCRFVFIGFAKSEAITKIFRDRMRRAFAAAGLDAERHVVIQPPMSQFDYMAAVAVADVVLDTPGWSGGKSTLDCLACDPAIVTLPGRFMRGRHTAAILRRIGAEATIARSVDDYVAIAVRLVRDAGWRKQVRQAVARGKHRAFRDLGPIRALETFLADAAVGHDDDGQYRPRR